MTKKDEPAKKVLATGAQGDPAHPEAGAPLGAAVFVRDTPPDTVTEAKKEDEK